VRATLDSSLSHPVVVSMAATPNCHPAVPTSPPMEWRNGPSVPAGTASELSDAGASTNLARGGSPRELALAMRSRPAGLRACGRAAKAYKSWGAS